MRYSRPSALKPPKPLSNCKSVGRSKAGAPSATAAVYVTLAEQALGEAQAALEAFMADELAEFERAVQAAGIGLFSGVANR